MKYLLSLQRSFDIKRTAASDNWIVIMDAGSWP